MTDKSIDKEPLFCFAIKDLDTGEIYRPHCLLGFPSLQCASESLRMEFTAEQRDRKKIIQIKIQEVINEPQ